MAFGTIEVLATIIIAISVIKLIVLSVSPKSWLKFAKRFYENPKITSVVVLIFAGLVLYLLLGAGITIVEVFAVTLFISLLMVVSLARYANKIYEYYNKKTKSIWKDHWLDTIVWIVLLIWGIKELFF